MSAWGGIGSCTSSRDVLLGVTEWRTYEEVVISCARHDRAEGGMWTAEGVREGARGGLEGSKKGDGLLQMRRVVTMSRSVGGKIGVFDGMCD